MAFYSARDVWTRSAGLGTIILMNISIWPSLKTDESTVYSELRFLVVPIITWKYWLIKTGKPADRMGNTRLIRMSWRVRHRTRGELVDHYFNRRAVHVPLSLAARLVLWFSVSSVSDLHGRVPFDSPPTLSPSCAKAFLSISKNHEVTLRIVPFFLPDKPNKPLIRSTTRNLRGQP